MEGIQYASETKLYQKNNAKSEIKTILSKKNEKCIEDSKKDIISAEIFKKKSKEKIQKERHQIHKQF